MIFGDQRRFFGGEGSFDIAVVNAFEITIDSHPVADVIFVVIDFLRAESRKLAGDVFAKVLFDFVSGILAVKIFGGVDEAVDDFFRLKRLRRRPLVQLQDDSRFFFGPGGAEREEKRQQ